MILPDCMAPDGADPCKGYQELKAENDQLRDALKTLYEWADNWDSPFMEDDEWPEDEAKIKAALGIE